MNCDVRQDFPVNLNLRSLESVNQAAVRQTIYPSRCIDASYPKSPEMPLALTTVAVSVLARLDNGLFRNLEGATACAVVALSLAKHFLVARPGDYPTFDSSHDCFLSCKGAFYGRLSRPHQQFAESRQAVVFAWRSFWSECGCGRIDHVCSHLSPCAGTVLRLPDYFLASACISPTLSPSKWCPTRRAARFNLATRVS